MYIRKAIVIILMLIMTFTLAATAKEKDNVDDIFKEAEVAYSWFTSFCIHTTIGKLDFENPPLVLDGTKYYKLIDGITNMDNLKSHLLTLFSPEVVENLLSSEIDGHKYFIEKDRNLYYTLDAIGLNDYTIGERKLTIKGEYGNSITCELEYKVVDDDGNMYKKEYIEYQLVKNDSGNYVFTSFTLPASKWTFYENNPQSDDTVSKIGFIIILAVVTVIFKRYNYLYINSN